MFAWTASLHSTYMYSIWGPHNNISVSMGLLASYVRIKSKYTVWNLKGYSGCKESLHKGRIYFFSPFLLGEWERPGGRKTRHPHQASLQVSFDPFKRDSLTRFLKFSENMLF